ncbi:MAG: pirin family protein [Marinomonas sp.]|uniref:pirin family protein n=1 Tax=Marinomonas communis TaxID=28254 RepID=UPI000FFFCE7E|nr:pirin family protein [Marinomonas communis]MCC4274528.1 pirin family protein [Marinomonas communis]RUM55064.1 MAG: pirin family protein [Marinomonas sp.]
MITIRPAEERGHANFGWLDSHHTFSFGHYYDPKHMGFSSLRVINDDTVSPSMGFETHGHKDMEIISLVTQGTIAHKDSAGNVRELPAGEYQLMSAGKGIFHSEFNASRTDTLKFLQIWIQPNSVGGSPGYQQKSFGESEGFTTIITPNGRDGTLQIKQDMSLTQLILKQQDDAQWPIQKDRRYYVHIVEGQLTLNDDIELGQGDGAKIEQLELLKFAKQSEQVKVLLFDLI